MLGNQLPSSLNSLEPLRGIHTGGTLRKGGVGGGAGGAVRGKGERESTSEMLIRSTGSFRAKIQEL